MFTLDATDKSTLRVRFPQFATVAISPSSAGLWYAILNDDGVAVVEDFITLQDIKHPQFVSD